jgi:hypothetical protein
MSLCFFSSTLSNLPPPVLRCVCMRAYEGAILCLWERDRTRLCVCGGGVCVRGGPCVCVHAHTHVCIHLPACTCAVMFA